MLIKTLSEYKLKIRMNSKARNIRVLSKNIELCGLCLTADQDKLGNEFQKIAILMPFGSHFTCFYSH